MFSLMHLHSAIAGAHCIHLVQGLVRCGVVHSYIMLLLGLTDCDWIKTLSRHCTVLQAHLWARKLVEFRIPFLHILPLLVSAGSIAACLLMLSGSMTRI